MPNGSQPSGDAAHLHWMRKHHVIAVGAAIPLIGELHGLGFPSVVGGPRHQDIVASPRRLPDELPAMPGIVGARCKFGLLPALTAIRTDVDAHDLPLARPRGAGH